MAVKLDDTIALITVNEFQTMSGEAKDVTGLKADQLTTLINNASQMIEKYLNPRKLIDGTAIEIFSGKGQHERWVDQGMINSLTKIEYWDGTDWAELAAASYPRTTDANTGRVYLNDGGVFADGQDNYRVTYTYGWSRADIPPDIKAACIWLVQRMRKLIDKAEGLDTQSFDSHQTAYNLKQLFSENCRTVLDRYKTRLY